MNNYDEWKLQETSNESDFYECEEEMNFVCDNSDMFEEFKSKVEELAKQYGVEIC